ncbi:TusE/DsrC/DsvC family sulfur relay protein [Thiothrix litoralis]|uniref:TusE/DsrC/DsvC family sulfur relay protein n=1 Tax=Thiothrix litoralis TaxID=2891210 RepID=A0ABX7WXJ3_9GAMM|nr:MULTISPECIES: TusE/DsrC/DsvC family sulfur relay protein [Thiothrix]QTR46334.1 TusE/DsrC/DsvC family sulfur relay protein [Thiothrix litoralis]WMP17765.1 TusE/DsrC/DsvC family sulfur relay protein [Thiothrix lacustris]
MAVQQYDDNLQTNPYAIYTVALDVDGKQVLTDQEGYIQNMDEWSESFVEAPVRDMLKHFKKAWGEEFATNHYLHEIFPKGGPQKQGNRLAGIRRTKGEH